MSPALTSAVVAYLGLVAVLAVAASLGAPVETAARTGFVVAQVCVGLLVVADLVSLLLGHRPTDTVTHVGYALAAPAVPLLVAGPRRDSEDPTPLLLVALVMVVVAVVVVRLGQTWA